MMDAADMNLQLVKDLDWFNNCTDQYTKVDNKTLKVIIEQDIEFLSKVQILSTIAYIALFLECLGMSCYISIKMYHKNARQKKLNESSLHYRD